MSQIAPRENSPMELPRNSRLRIVKSWEVFHNVPVLKNIQGMAENVFIPSIPDQLRFPNMVPSCAGIANPAIEEIKVTSDPDIKSSDIHHVLPVQTPSIVRDVHTFVLNQLRSDPNFKEGGKIDLEGTKSFVYCNFGGKDLLLFVLTLGKRKDRNNSYEAGFHVFPPKKTLLVLVNEETTKFALMFVDEIVEKQRINQRARIFLNFGNSKTKGQYDRFKITNAVIFQNQLLRMARESCKVPDEISSNLLKNTHPSLRILWHPENSISFDEVLTRSDKPVKWICSICKYVHEQIVRAQVRVYETISKNFCPNCTEIKRNERKQAIALYEEEKERLHNIDDRTKSSIGDATEFFVRDVLEELKRTSEEYKNILIERVAHESNCIFDFYITFEDGIKRGIQVKTLTKVSVDDRYMFRIVKPYPNDTLLVLVDNTRTRFGLAYSQDISQLGSIYLIYCSTDTIYERVKVVDLEIFKSNLIEMAKNAVPVDPNTMSLYQERSRKEREMMIRLQEKCNKEGLHFAIEEKSATVVDCYINGYRIQCKYRSLTSKGTHTYRVSLRHHKKGLYIPYDVEDVDFYIFEVGGTLDIPGRYKGNFVILSNSVLLSIGAISSGVQGGVGYCYLYPPDYPIKKWSTDFWNKFDQLSRDTPEQDLDM